MDYAGAEKDLYNIYESEILGETLFRFLAGRARDPQRKRKWQALADLETQTKERYLAFVADKPALSGKPEPSRFKGYLSGWLFLLLPWRTAMKLLGDGTAPFMEVFTRLRQHAAPEDAAFFDYVVAHEVAIKAFADAEQAGQENALQPVLDLLDTH